MANAGAKPGRTAEDAKSAEDAKREEDGSSLSVFSVFSALSAVQSICPPVCLLLPGLRVPGILLRMNEAVRTVSTTEFPIAVLLSGQGRTLANLLVQIAQGALPVRIRCVIGSKPNLRGVAIAAEAGIPHHVIPRRDFPDAEAFSAAIWEMLAPAGVQLVVHAGFLHKLLVAPGWEGRVINIHPSLLPAFGGKGMYGGHVHAAVLGHGCKVSGCTVHICDDAYDAGPIVAQQCVPVRDDDTPESLSERVFAAECVLYPAVIRAFAQGRIQQRGRHVTIAQETTGTPCSHAESED